jgi:hypothetical protein
MLERFKLTAFVASLLPVGFGTTITNADPNTVVGLKELNYSNSSTLSLLAGKEEEKPTGVNFASDAFSLRPSQPS